METFEQLVARTNASSYLINDDPTGQVKGKKRKSARKPTRISKSIEKLGADQVEVLLDVMQGQCRVLVHDGEKYLAYPGNEVWTVKTLDGRHEHAVYNDLSACSCEDHRFRGRTCKHMQMLQSRPS